MPTIEDLGNNVENSYPDDYAGYDPRELGLLMKKRYPGMYDEYTDTAMTAPRSQSLTKSETPTRSQSLTRSEISEEITLRQIEEAKRFYHPNRSILTNWWQRLRSEGRVKLLSVLNQEQMLAIEQGAMLGRAILDGKKSAIEFEVFVAQNALVLLSIRYDAQLFEQAMQSGLTVQNDQEQRMKQIDSNMRIAEHKAKTEIDLEARWIETVQDHEGADMLELTPLRLIEKKTQQLEKLYQKKYEVKHSFEPQEVKKKILKRLKKNIKSLEAEIDAEQNRLVLPANR